jgi:hypothetical protein
MGGTNDFWLHGNYSSTPSFFNFSYASATDPLTDIYQTFTGTLTIADADVPEPATVALFGLGLASAGIARRKKA